MTSRIGDIELIECERHSARVMPSFCGTHPLCAGCKKAPNGVEPNVLTLAGTPGPGRKRLSSLRSSKKNAYIPRNKLVE